jgi:molecular chaperone DnaJ
VADSPRDYYEVLGVSRDADAKTIKDAFRRLARRYHPDASSEPEAAERFKEIAEAYGVLSDPARRSTYDAGGFARYAGPAPEDVWAGIDFGDIFGVGEPGIGANLFERLFGRPFGTSPRRGGYLKVDVTIPLQQVLTGSRQDITLPRPGACRKCLGSGADPGTPPRHCAACAGTGQQTTASHHGNLIIQQMITCPACQGRGAITDRPCPACRGSGRSAERETITIGIPAGIPEETSLRLPGYGLPSPSIGGPPGDAYVIVRTQSDPRWTRAGADLWQDLHVSVADAALGTAARIPALVGDVKVRIAPGTQTGTVVRIAGQGLPRYGQPGRGSMNVTVTVDIPQQMTPGQRRLYEQLRAEEAAVEVTAAQSPDRRHRIRDWIRRHRNE